MSAFLLRYGVYTPNSYSTNFPLTENPLSESGRWQVGGITGFYANPRTTPGKCFAATTVTPGEDDDALGVLLTPAFNANYSVSVTISKSVGSKTNSFEVGIYGRRARVSTDFYRGYEVLIGFNPGEFQVIKWLGIAHDLSNFTILSTSGSPAAVSDGDIFRADFIGNVITVYRNGTLFNTTTDSSSPWLDGAPGMGFFCDPANTPSDYCISSWSTNVI